MESQELNVNELLIVPGQNIVHIVNLNNIIFCKSENYYTHIHLCEGNEVILVKSLSKLEKELNNGMFIRISQQYMVNRFFIVSIDKKRKQIVLKNDIYVSYTVALKKLIEMIKI